MVRKQPFAVRLLWEQRRLGCKGQLSATEAATIVAAGAEHGTIAEVVRETGRSHTTVGKVIRRFNATGSIVSTRRGNQGRPRTATSPAVVRAVTAAFKRPRDGEHVPSAREVRRKLALPYTDQSVRNAAKAGGLTSQAMRQRPFLTAKDRKKREIWARKMCRRPRPVDWRRTICSDEKVFLLKQHQRRCFAPTGMPRRRYNKHHPESLLVWGGISLVGCTEPIFMRGVMDGTAYQKTLELGLVPLARTIRGPWHFQQDNARPHTSAATKAWLTANPIIPLPIPWPANSADLSPIENLWALVQADVDAQSKIPTTLEELERAVAAAWRSRTSCLQCLEGLLGKWCDRVESVSRNGGASLEF